MHRARGAAATRFTEVKAKPPDEAFVRYVEAGLRALERNPSSEASRTLRWIHSHRVRVDGFSDLSAADFRHLRRDLPELSLSLEDYPRLRNPRSPLVRAIEGSINGYMWDNRVYVARGMRPERLASILVHEVFHVLHRAEENYRSPRAVLRQEYAAFYAERRFAGVEMTPERCLALKRMVIRRYELKGVTPADVPDRIPLPASRGT